MNTNIKIIVGIGLVLVIIFGLLKLNSCHSDNIKKDYTNKVEEQRDSLINALMIEKEFNQKLHKSNADSAIIYAKGYRLADSINKSYWSKKIKQIHKYTPQQRNDLYDSLFGKSY